MRYTKYTTLLIAAAALSVPGAASAQNTKEIFLRAGVTTLTLPDTSVVTMWGYAQDSGAAAEDGALQVPGPVIELATTDSTLLVHLKNRLPEATSLVVAGLRAVNPGEPTRAADGRALSFSAETAPAATGDYTFAAKPGTFLYHSGSHPAVQVQMGLYGAVKKNFAAGVAYAGTPAFATDAVLVLSEIDPALHQAVAAGQFGAGKAVTSTVQYAPRYFLVNGQPFTSSTVPIAAAPAGSTTLLRILNASPTTRIPTVLDQYLTILSDSGNKLPFPKTQYSIHLPALQTVDALLTPAAAGTVTLFDRGLGLSNGFGQLAGGAGSFAMWGGMTAKLSVAAPIALKRSLGLHRFSPKKASGLRVTRHVLRAPQAQAR